MASLARAELLAPENARIPYAKATIFARSGRNGEALQELKRAMEIEPASADARQLLQALLKQNDSKYKTHQ